MARQTIGSVLCCICGTLMKPSGPNMCANCFRSEADITKDLQKRVTITHCPNCDSYFQHPNTWIKAELESGELLGFCCKMLKLKKFHLRNAEFIWTEPHSKRIKVRLTVQKEILNGIIVEQAYVVEYVVQDNLCGSCSRFQANPDQWVASVQLRQKNVSHKRTLLFLEQLILKHDAIACSLGITKMEEGFDVLFRNRSHAVKFVEFVRQFAPATVTTSDKLKSHDGKSNTHTFEYKFSVHIPPVCRDDLIFLPYELAVSLGNFGPLVICTKVTKNIALLDPFTLRGRFLDAKEYWRSKFESLCSIEHLIEYMVLDVEPDSSEVKFGGSKYVSAYVQVARVSDFRTIFYVRTHLGHLLNVGDHVLGYDVRSAKFDDAELAKYKKLDLPEVILVKKKYKKKLDCGKSNGEMKNAESVQSLREMEQKFKTVLDISSSCNDTDDVIANLFEDLLDINEEELVGDYMSE